jgi:hypothetical protein
VGWDEPDAKSVEATSPTAISAIVIRFIRTGVSQAKWRRASHVLVPVATVLLDIAAIMHCTHIASG